MASIASLFREAGAMLTHVPEVELTESGVTTLFAPLADLDVLVNGAVRTGPWQLEELTLDEWDTVHRINVRGAFLLMREAVRVMKKHGRGGRLISISTIGSINPVLHGNYAYSCSRAGTNALTRQFALDFAADGIQSNAILVGQVPSDPFPEGVRAPSGPGVDRRRHGTVCVKVARRSARLSSEGSHIDRKSIFDVTLHHAFVRFIDLLNGNDFDVGSHIVGGAKIQHLLGLGDTAYH